MQANFTHETLEDVIKAEIRKSLMEFFEVQKDTIEKTISAALSENYGDEDPLLNRDEAANYLRIKKNTLSIWITDGRGPAPSKLGSRTLYRKSALDDFVAKNTLPR